MSNYTEDNLFDSKSKKTSRIALLQVLTLTH